MKTNLLKTLIIMLALSMISLYSCKKEDMDEDEKIDNNDPNNPNPPVPGFDDSYFPYTKNSLFQYSIEYRDSDNDITTGEMLLEVVDVDSVNHIATLSVSLVYNSGFPLGEVIYMKKTSDNLIQVSSGGTTWATVLDLNENPATDMSFVIAGPIGMPSNFLGSINRSVGAASITVPAGTFSGMKVLAEYMPSGNDPYTYSNDCIEYYSEDQGLVYSYDYYYDAEMGYPYIISVTRTVELTGYKIYKADGTVLEGGSVSSQDIAPESPSNLEVSRTSTTSAHLTWSDNSLNESQFEVERKEYETGSWQSIATVNKNINEYTDNTIVANTRYEYRVFASNNYGNSAYSEEIVMNLYGVPQAPYDLSGGYNTNLYFVYLMWWAKINDNISHFKIAFWTGTEWVDLDFDVAADIQSVVDDHWLQSTYIYYNGGYPWPSGTYRFKVKAINSYGESFYSEYVDVTI